MKFKQRSLLMKRVIRLNEFVVLNLLRYKFLNIMGAKLCTPCRKVVGRRVVPLQRSMTNSTMHPKLAELHSHTFGSQAVSDLYDLSFSEHSPQFQKVQNQSRAISNLKLPPIGPNNGRIPSARKSAFSKKPQTQSRIFQHRNAAQVVQNLQRSLSSKSFEAKTPSSSFLSLPPSPVNVMIDKPKIEEPKSTGREDDKAAAAASSNALNRQLSRKSTQGLTPRFDNLRSQCYLLSHRSHRSWSASILPEDTLCPKLQNPPNPFVANLSIASPTPSNRPSLKTLPRPKESSASVTSQLFKRPELESQDQQIKEEITSQASSRKKKLPKIEKLNLQLEQRNSNPKPIQKKFIRSHFFLQQVDLLAALRQKKLMNKTQENSEKPKEDNSQTSPASRRGSGGINIKNNALLIRPVKTAARRVITKLNLGSENSSDSRDTSEPVGSKRIEILSKNMSNFSQASGGFASPMNETSSFNISKLTNLGGISFDLSPATNGRAYDGFQDVMARRTNHDSERDTPYKSQKSLFCSDCERTTHRVYKQRGKNLKMINQYVIIKPLGRGSFGKVKQVLDRNSKRFYAMKVLRRGQGQDDEVAIMMQLRHPHVVRVVEILDDPNREKLYIVMELMPGGSLEQLLKRKILTINESRSFFIQLMQGLAHCHRADPPVVHRDLKPANLLLDSNHTHLKIADFGVARININVMGAVGSTYFMAPEMISGEQHDGRMADIWASGVILYRMVLGNYPFTGAHPYVLYKKIATQEPIYPTSLTPELRDLLKQMLNKEPEKRITLAEIVDHPWLISHEECVLPLHFRPSVRLSPPDPLTVVKQKRNVNLTIHKH